MWEIFGSRRVGKQFDGMDKPLRGFYDNELANLELNPYDGKKITGHDNLWSWKVYTPYGKHRILYRIKEEDKVVYVILIGTRESIYDLLKRSGKKY